jgi:uncharacterized protein YndB with AHSA1/START domain/DNA-binding transcriptional ArsR family regulator
VPRDDDVDDVIKALADPTRRQLLDNLNERNGQTLRQLCGGLDMARQSVSKHLDILESANLITTVWRGREKLHYLNAAPINEIAERWINQYDRGRIRALADLKRALEQPMPASSATPTSPEEFVYTTYIHTTPEQLWRALTEPVFTRQYWGIEFDTDWKQGSPMVWRQAGATTADPAQVVIESDPYRRLAYTWHTFTPEWSKAVGVSDEVRDSIADERRSTVTFEIEPDGDQVRLTVLHGGFEPGSVVRTMISGGWPKVLSALKTFLETASVSA